MSRKLRQGILEKLAELLGVPDKNSVRESLFRCARRGTGVHTIIDIGAAVGRWTEDVALPVFPDAEVILVEAQDVHRDALDALVARRPKVRYVAAAAGEHVGVTYFDVADPFGGCILSGPGDMPCAQVPMTTVDACVSEAGLPGPYLLKLDTHGLELPILRGAQSVLEDTSLIVMEVYNFKLRDDESVRFWEMCAHMETIGFRCVDICDALRRPGDGALWQVDIVFQPIDSAVFASNSYS